MKRARLATLKSYSYGMRVQRIASYERIPIRTPAQEEELKILRRLNEPKKG